MKKIIRILVLVIFIALMAYAGYYFYTSNNQEAEIFDTEAPALRDLERKTVATGKVIPVEEVAVKPQVSGIISKIYVKEAQSIKKGTLIAQVKVVPDEQSLNSARNRIKNAEINLKNAKANFNRNKPLFDEGVISEQTFQPFILNLDQAQQELENAKSDYKIIKEGSAGGDQANTNIRASATGTILEIPVEEGDQVIQSNTFNDGTTIATIADLSKMIFEGMVDESEVGRLFKGMPVVITLGAIQDTELQGTLNFIAPKGVEEEGAVQFKIKADFSIPDSVQIRAGYSANATIILESRKQVVAIKEALLQFDSETNQPFVEVETEEQKFERMDVELGISDGIWVEILDGINQQDSIKVWKKTVSAKIEK